MEIIQRDLDKIGCLFTQVSWEPIRICDCNTMFTTLEHTQVGFNASHNWQWFSVNHRTMPSYRSIIIALQSF